MKKLHMVLQCMAQTAYAGFLEFKVVVKKYQIASTDIKLWPFKVHEP